MNMRSIMTFLFLVLALSNPAPAQTELEPEQQVIPERFVFQWTDDNGEIHLTDDPGQVPQKYRSKSLKKRAEPRPEKSQEQPEGGLAQPEESEVRPAPRSRESSDQDFAQRRREYAWRERYLEWKNKLQQSEERYRSLLQRRANLTAPWGGLALAPPPVVEEFVQVEKSLKDTEAELDEARHMVEVVLPDEARKAGVPPGWLRE